MAGHRSSNDKFPTTIDYEKLRFTPPSSLISVSLDQKQLKDDFVMTPISDQYDSQNRSHIEFKGETDNISHEGFPSCPKITGPGLWFWIHITSLDATTKSSKEYYIHNLTLLSNRHPCGMCRSHMKSYLNENPPQEFMSIDKGLFIHSVNFHNAVNRRLGKSVLSLKDAYNMYEYQLDEEFCTIGCGSNELPVSDINHNSVGYSRKVVDPIISQMETYKSTHIKQSNEGYNKTKLSSNIPINSTELIIPRNVFSLPINEYISTQTTSALP